MEVFDLSAVCPLRHKDLLCGDLSGGDTGWQNVGSWATIPDQPPSQPILPGAPGVGFQHLFMIEATDPDGAGDIRSIELDIGSGSKRCSIAYLRAIQDGVEFLNDDGSRSGWVVNIPGTASNSSCSLDLLRASSSTQGNTETVLLPVTFLTALAGGQPMQVIVTDWSGATGQLTTSWTVAPSSAPPVISAEGIVNGASWQSGGLITPVEIVTIFGSGWGPSTLQVASVVNGELQQTVAGTTLFFGNMAAPLLYVSESAVSAIVPSLFQLSDGVEVASNGGISKAVPARVALAVPGIFTYPISQQAAALNQDFSYNSDIPAARGTYVSLYVTGVSGIFFYNNAEYFDFGGIPPSNPWAMPGNLVLVQFGDNAPVPASFAGLTFPGVAQVNAYIDANAPTGDAVSVRVITRLPSLPDTISPAATIRIK